MVVRLLLAIGSLYLFPFTGANVETLHFESACLNASDLVQLNLRCSLYEHIKIIRVIYGYSKQRTLHQCQFSIYDCIQEGASRNILSCHGKQTCIINLTKREILGSKVTANGVPACPDFNYVQVNFGCIPDANDICDSWKDAGSIVYLTHTRSRDKQYNECQCKVRSSSATGQVLLQAKEMNRQFEDDDSPRPSRASNTDCKKTTYLEIATDRSERKCMDNLPANGNALFGSGSHNFTLTYVRNDPLSELFFYFELKASPMRKDHHVQVICNWARRTTTVRTTLPMIRRRKSTSMSVLSGGRQSRLDLIRHSPTSEEQAASEEAADEPIVVDHSGVEDEGDETIHASKSKKHRKKPATSTAVVSLVPEDDDEWSRISSINQIESSALGQQTFPLDDNQTLLSSAQALITPLESNSRARLTTKKYVLISLFTTFAVIFLVVLYCLKVKQATCVQRLKMNLNVVFLFCCEASKLLFSASRSSHSMSRTSSSEGTHQQRHSPPMPIADYQSSVYYMNDTRNNCPTIASIYDYDGYGEKSIYSIYTDNNVSEDSQYTTRYGRYQSGETC